MQTPLLEGLRHACARQENAAMLPLWLALLEEKLDFSGVLRHMRESPGLTYLTVDTTGVCDLKCPGMCYYNPNIDTRRPFVTLEALEAAIRDGYQSLGMLNLVFAGKEPLLGVDRLVHLAKLAASFGDSRLGIGIVTNGRNIAKRWDKLDNLAQSRALSFIDISLDSGHAHEHDVIRGVPGTFELASTALRRCAESWPGVRVGATSVLRPDNRQGIYELLRRLVPFNRNFFITPIQPPPFGTVPILPWAYVRDFLTGLLDRLTHELADRDLEVMVSLLGLYIWDAAADGFISWKDLREDDQGQIYVEREVGGNRFVLHMQIFPETGWRVGRILNTGDYLPNTHFVQDSRPERFAIGNVGDESLPHLYNRALDEHGILGRMLASRNTHECRQRSCWSACFGALAATEHSFVNGLSLNKRPVLCLKT